jgi:ribosome-associated translation inhibitor RaiA
VPAGTAWVSGDQDHITVRWTDGTAVSLRIAHGQIVEQWWTARESAPPDEVWPFALPVVSRGHVAARAKSYAAEKVAALADEIGRPVLFGRVVLTQHADPAASGLAVAEASLDVDGSVVRGRAAAPTMFEAIDFALARLRRRLHGRDSRPRLGPAPRHPALNRRIDERTVVRHKTVATTPMAIEEALDDLDALDLDFYLFSDLASGADAVVAHEGDHVVLHVAGGDPALLPHVPGVSIVPAPVPRLAVTGAQEWLDLTDDHFVFFVDAANERGSVLYRRYDGNYGLIGPAS